MTEKPFWLPKEMLGCGGRRSNHISKIIIAPITPNKVLLQVESQKAFNTGVKKSKQRYEGMNQLDLVTKKQSVHLNDCPKKYLTKTLTIIQKKQMNKRFINDIFLGSVEK